MRNKKVRIEIKSWLNGSVLFGYECVNNTIAKTLEKAVEEDANLSYADLHYANLSYADLRYANLRYADLRYANLSYADLRYANLSYADLRYADLRYAKNLNKYHGSDLSLLLLQKNRLTAYKFLTSDMHSPIQTYNRIKYEVGKEYIENVNKDRLEECGEGLNVASLEWCLRETQGNIKDYKFIEVSFDPKDLVVPYFSDGKFRVSKLKVERKLTQKELKPFIEVIK